MSRAVYGQEGNEDVVEQIRVSRGGGGERRVGGGVGETKVMQRIGEAALW